MEDILKALERIDGKGSFYAQCSLPLDKLKLEINNLGTLKFPISSRHIKFLINLAKPAKFGWRNKTLLDRSVRNAWEIPKNQIKIDYTRWHNALDSALNCLREDLGLSDNITLKAELHNLLIYERNQFFCPHQDLEKSDSMIASLVIVLPSEHRGGSLMIYHHGKKKELKTDSFPLDKFSLIAFYADCHHEVKKVEKGFRVTLTYNLVLKENNKKNPKTKNDSKSEAQTKLIKALQKYFSDNLSTQKEYHYNNTPKQLIYLLDHSYTQKGLSWKHLKNDDRLRAEALKNAADTLELEITMALANVRETWNCEIDDDEYSYYHQYEENDTRHDIECTDLIDCETVLKHWIDEQGKSLKLEEYYVSDKYICWTKSSNEFKPFDSEYEGFMGNYGNTMDHWYHRAAVVLWQKKDHYPMLLQISSNTVIDSLYQLTKDKSETSKIKEIMTNLLPYWKGQVQDHTAPAQIKKIFKLAAYINDSARAKEMIQHFSIGILSCDISSLLLPLNSIYGSAWIIDIFNCWTSEKKQNQLIEKISRIIKIFLEDKDTSKLTAWLLAYQLAQIKKEDEYCQKNYSHAEFLESLSERISFMLDLCHACIISDDINTHLSIIEYIIQSRELYPPLALLEFMDNIKKESNLPRRITEEYKKLLAYMIKNLKAEKAEGLRKKNDWSIKENILCSCKDCVELKAFLYSSDLITLTWLLGKDRRAHIHQQIEKLGIPVTHQTKHIGSPHQLILTKTPRLHAEAKQRFEKITQALKYINSDLI